MALFQELNIQAVMLGETDTKLGSVETWAHAKQCADLFKANRDTIEGVLVVLPNFGDEKGVADTLRLAGLDVPVLIQAYPDALDRLNVERRRAEPQACADVQAGDRAGRLDGGERDPGHRAAVLVVAAAQLWRQRLHDHEHDERAAAAERM
jgi:L-fucose isomerase-like protein